jgi:hypothetical protein
MDDDEIDQPRKTYPLSPAKMSKTPSWVMLGFFLGAAFVWSFQRESEKAEPKRSVGMTDWPKAVRVEPSPLTTIEAVFAKWGDAAVWDKDLTEVALWRSETGGFTEFYEVRRVGPDLYFRSISNLTRLVIRHGTPPADEVPLRFTETQAQYNEWLEHGRFERSPEATVQPTLLGPALIPPGEAMPRVRAPKNIPMPTPAPAGSEFQKAKIENPAKG